MTQMRMKETMWIERLEEMKEFRNHIVSARKRPLHNTDLIDMYRKLEKEGCVKEIQKFKRRNKCRSIEMLSSLDDILGKVKTVELR